MIQKEKHVEFVKKVMNSRNLLYYITEQDRMATMYWAVNSLRLLKDPIFGKIKPQVIQFVFSCLSEHGGFAPNFGYSPNILATFNALQLLFMYNVPYYDEKTVKFILSLQIADGSFTFDMYGDIDTRFDCCAILSLHILSIMKHYTYLDLAKGRAMRKDEALDPFSLEDLKMQDACHSLGMVELDRTLLSKQIDRSFLHDINFNINITLNHLLECFNPDGGVGQIKGSESHAAQVFCVISSLRSLGCLDAIDRSQTLDFLVYRQTPSGGLCGRVNKKEDVCYSFWALAAMIILGSKPIDLDMLVKFILSCEDCTGGFSDRPQNEPDIYHLMFSLASLSLLGDEEINVMDPGFAI